MRQQFIDNVKSGDLSSVRISLANELMLDPRGASFDEMLKFAEANMSNLYEADNGVKFSDDSSMWNKELLYEIKNELDFNFSRQKLSLYKRVATVVLREKGEQLNKEYQKQSQYEENTRTEKVDNSKNIYNKVILGGVVVAIAGLLLPKTITAKAVVSAIGVATVVIGRVLNEKSK